MATRADTSSPYGVGKGGVGFFLLVAILLVLIGVGVVAYTKQFIEGDIATGMRDLGTMGGAPWGLYVAFEIHFVGVAFAGITIAALIRIFNLDHLRAIARIAVFLTVVMLVLGSLSILADLGHPLRGIINLMRYARPQSPFFGTFTLVISGYLFATLVYLYLEGRKDAAVMARRPGWLKRFYRIWAAGYRDTQAERDRHARTAWWLAIAIIPLLVVAHSTLGFVFGLQSGQAGWFSALQAPGFVVLAGVSGVGHVIVLSWLARVLLRLGEQITLRTFSWLANVLWILVAVYLYFMVVEMITGVYAGPTHEADVIRSLLSGEYAWIYWMTVGLMVVAFVVLFVQFLRRRYAILPIAAAGLAVGIAGVGKRYLIVVPSQTHGSLLPYLPGSYTPNWVEIAVVVGLLALGGLALVLFFRVFPIMSVSDEEERR